MMSLWAGLNWAVGVVFILLSLAVLLAGNPFAAIPFAGIVLLTLPPVRQFVHRRTGWTTRPWLRATLCVLLFLAFPIALFAPMVLRSSVYDSPDVEARLMAIYDEKLADWEVPHESVYVDTRYGRAHVIVSGPEDGEPVVLLCAGNLTAVSWGPNVAALSGPYRTYAIDTIGEAGRSTLHDASSYPMDGASAAGMYFDVCDSLGIDSTLIVGASYGGFLAVNMAVLEPARVRRIALLGPMGLTPATGKTLARIMLVTVLPMRWVQEDMITWTFGDGETVQTGWGGWLRLVMDGVVPREAPPLTFTSNQLAGITVPVLLVLGAHDNLTGDPDHVRELAASVPDIRIEVIDSGHAMGVERPDLVNPLLMGFLGDRE